MKQNTLWNDIKWISLSFSVLGLKLFTLFPDQLQGWISSTKFNIISEWNLFWLSVQKRNNISMGSYSHVQSQCHGPHFFINGHSKASLISVTGRHQKCSVKDTPYTFLSSFHTVLPPLPFDSHKYQFLLHKKSVKMDHAPVEWLGNTLLDIWRMGQNEASNVANKIIVRALESLDSSMIYNMLHYTVFHVFWESYRSHTGSPLTRSNCQQS